MDGNSQKATHSMQTHVPLFQELVSERARLGEEASRKERMSERCERASEIVRGMSEQASEQADESSLRVESMSSNPKGTF